MTYDDGMDLFNQVADVYIWCAGRRGGKTLSTKGLFLKDFLRRGNTFAWVRNTREELKKTRSDFCMDIGYKVPPIEAKNFKVVGSEVLYKSREEKDEKAEYMRVGDFFYMSGASNARGAADPNRRNICLDEFMGEHNEASFETLGDLFSLVITCLSKRRDGRVILLSNYVSPANPFFRVFKVKIPEDRNRGIITKSVIPVEMADRDGKKIKRNVTVLAKFGYVQDQTEDMVLSTAGAISLLYDKYGKYAIGNESLVDRGGRVVPMKDLKAVLKFRCNLHFNNQENGLYWSDKSGFMFFGKPDPSGACYVVDDLTLVGSAPRYKVIGKKHPVISSMVNNYVNGLVCFEDPFAQKNFVDIINWAL